MPCLAFQFGALQALLRHDRAGLIQGPSTQQRLGLREAVGHQQQMLMRQIRLMPFLRHKEFARDHPRALMDQLVKGVLAVGAGLAPDHGAGVGGQVAAVDGDALAV